MSKDQNNNVISLLYDHVKNIPLQPAFIWGDDNSISYEEFAKKTSSLAAHLKTLGLKKGDTVLIFVPLSIELYMCMFAVQQIGAVAVFLDSWARKDQLKMCVEISEACAMISFDKAFHYCSDIKEIEDLPVKISIEKLPENYNSCPVEPVELDDTALITFTTGSSGKPKGANRTHRFLSAQHTALKKVLPYTEKVTDLPVFPIFALNNLASGITTLIPSIDLSSPSMEDGKTLAHQILSHNVSSVTLSPSLFVAVSGYCNNTNIKLPSLSRVVTGGAPISRDNIEDFKKLAPKAEILVLYGSTEVEPIAHIEADEMLACMDKDMGVNVGPIADGLEYKLLKITKEPIEINHNGWNDLLSKEGEVGELIVCGDHVCKGYYNDTEAFKKAKIKDQEGKIWHRTGDLGFIDEQGYFWFVGRVHNVIYRNKTPIFPLQAELLMKKLDGIKQAAFLGMPHPELGEQTVAVVSHLNSDSNEIIKNIKHLLTKNHILVDVIKVVDSIPMDPRHHSKVEYAKLKELL